jgi:hypothetical protein
MALPSMLSDDGMNLQQDRSCEPQHGDASATASIHVGSPSARIAPRQATLHLSSRFAKV